MKKQLLVFLGVSLGTLLSCSWLSGQGLVLRSETKADDSVQRGLLYILGDQLRLDTLGPAGDLVNSMIYDGRQDVIYAVDHKGKTLTRMDRQSVEQMASMMDQAMKQMNERLAGMPPEQRKMVEQMMKQRAPRGAPPVTRTIREGGGRKTVGGYACREFEILENGLKTGEIWVTDWNNFGASKSTFAVFEKMGDFMSGLTSALQRNSPVKVPIQNNFLTGMNQVDGAPVLVVRLRNGSVQSETRISVAKEISADPSLFVPPRYKEQSFSRRPNEE